VRREEYDAVIIGAGPAGSAAATVLAEHGHRVLVLEREKFPRYHIGESLLPFTFQPLKRLGMIEKMKASAFVKKCSVQFV
jgi:flavin-dependent dehydrogenase